LMQYREVFKRLEELTNLPDECYPELDVQHSSIYERELWRQFQTCPFITDNGYIGIAPPYIQEGDCISSFPEVVHRTFSGKNWKATISVLLAQHMSMVLWMGSTLKRNVKFDASLWFKGGLVIGNLWLSNRGLFWGLIQATYFTSVIGLHWSEFEREEKQGGMSVQQIGWTRFLTEHS